MHAQPTLQVVTVVLIVRLHYLQAREFHPRHLGEHLLGSRPGIVHGDSRNHRQQQPQGVCGDVTCVAADLFAPVRADAVPATSGLTWWRTRRRKALRN
jgi:hypothetical protein